MMRVRPSILRIWRVLSLVLISETTVSMVMGEDDSTFIFSKNRAWELFFQGMLWKQTLDNRNYLLEQYNCPSFEDGGIAQDDSSSTQPYSAIPNGDTWRLFEEAYLFAFDLEPVPPISDNESLEAWGGTRVPLEVRYNPGIGRSVHTTAFVPAGTTVWVPSHTASFTYVRYNEHPAFQILSYRHFIEYLYEDYQSMAVNAEANNWACDALMWTWHAYEIHEDEDGNFEAWKGELSIAFDKGSLFNNAMGNQKEENVEEYESEQIVNKFDPYGIDGISKNVLMKASRDIQPGEEIRYDYSYGDDDPELVEDTM